MILKEIYRPISIELAQLERELKREIGQVVSSEQKMGSIINHFFNLPGKRLRPALVLLSARSVNSVQPPTINDRLIRLATAVELIHSASLIHDDIIDDSAMRRNQVSLNKQFGHKIAVLAGDILYARAFSLLADRFDREILKILSQCAERMCRGEIIELEGSILSLEDYLRIIGDKTASLMSACCQCGAILAGAATETISAFKEYGFNFGISYQLMDDALDNDSIVSSETDVVERAREYSIQAKERITSLDDSEYKESLKNLAEFVIEKG